MRMLYFSVSDTGIRGLKNPSFQSYVLLAMLDRHASKLEETYVIRIIPYSMSILCNSELKEEIFANRPM